MIRYTLRCRANADHPHQFESWFASGTAFDRLLALQQVTCPECGSARVEKALMAPAVVPARKAGDASASGAPPDATVVPAPDKNMDPRQRALADLRRQVEQNADYVGMNFSTEARRIHSGLSPERAIYGEAKPDEARQLIEDGIPVAPLPFVPTSKLN